MRVLGVDPGTLVTGYGVIEQRPGHSPGGVSRSVGGSLVYIAAGDISGGRAQPLSARLLKIFQELTAIIRQYQPDCVAIEEPFVDKNIKTALKLGQAEGIAFVVAEMAKLPVTVYSPSTVKLALTGYGRAEKQQVGQMVRRLLCLETAPTSHNVADALAVAICHLHSSTLNQSVSALPAGIVSRRRRQRATHGFVRAGR